LISEKVGSTFCTFCTLGGLPDGVDKMRIIDREKNEYHEVVKKYNTDEIIHETHELLSKHKK
jgi:hypothetical protein